MTTEKDDRQNLRSLFKTLSILRDQDGEMPVQQMLVLVWIALNKGRTQRDLCQALDMATSTASRNIAALSKVHRLGKEGLDLVTWVEHPEDRRAKLLMLTTKGERLVERLIST